MAAEEIISAARIESRKKDRAGILRNIFLTILSDFLFALAFPGLFSEKGMSFTAFLFFIPLVQVLRTCRWRDVVPLGMIHGYLSYALFNYWLADFHPLTIFIVPLIYVVIYAVLFPVLKAGTLLFPRWGFLMQGLIWTSCEFLKSKGFLGYSYGTIGSVFYQNPLFVRASSLTGIWGLSFLIIVTGAWLGYVLNIRSLCRSLAEWVFFQRSGLMIAGFALVLISYGWGSRVELDKSPRYRIALTQHNADSWEGGYDAYRDNFYKLRELSLHSRISGDPELIVWPETAFVPTIHYHKTYKTNRRSLSLVMVLEEFLAGQDVPYLLGNDDARKEPVGEDGTLERVDYNAAVLYLGDEWKGLYRKRHLVPFTEYFPYTEQFPRVYQWLLDADTHFWKKGESFNIIDTGKFRIGTPICFEDTFGYISREFVRSGADIIVNLSNDAWSGSVVAERQHFMLSVFRAGENRRTMVRSTNSGITGWVDPNGVIREELEPFVTGVLIADVPVYTATETLYTLWGDWFAWMCLSASFLMLGAAVIIRLTERLISRRIRGENRGKNDF